MLNKHDFYNTQEAIKRFGYRLKFDDALRAHLIIGAFYITVVVVVLTYVKG